MAQQEESDPSTGATGSTASGDTTTEDEAGAGVTTGAAPAAKLFRGTVRLDTDRPVKHFGDISKEVLDHFASQVGTEVEVTIEVVARKPDGFAED